jgi:acetyltransferase-like isoleucine patch superfamily enzyme
MPTLPSRILRRLIYELSCCRQSVRLGMLNTRMAIFRMRGSAELAGTCILDGPFDLDGAGVVTLEDKVALGYRLAPRSGNGEIRLQARYNTSRIRIGESTALSNNVTIIAVKCVEIGARCLVGDHTLILDSDFHHMDAATRNAPNPPTAPVLIEADVWIGSRVTILKGVRIGARSVIAAGAVVTKSIPPDSVAAGIPARVVRSVTNPATSL